MEDWRWLDDVVDVADVVVEVVDAVVVFFVGSVVVAIGWAFVKSFYSTC